MSESLHTAPKPFVFVLMPFSESFDDVYKLAIKPACERSGAYCERVDEQHFDGSMLQRIYNQIAKADFIIADMSGKNPNVFYEVGYAHAIDKRVILVTNNSADIPFDLKHHPHIVYGSVSSLLEELEKRARWAVNNPKESALISPGHVAIYVGRSSIAHENEVKIGFRDARLIELDISINNTTDRVIEPMAFQFALETPTQWSLKAEIEDAASPGKPYATTCVDTQPSKLIYIVEQAFSILPDSWLRLKFSAIGDKGKVFPDEPQPFAVKLFTGTGTQIFRFLVSKM